jgi:hypothetical protein
MKISDIIVEAIDQKEADELLKSLVSANDPVAKYFQQTRYNPIHTTIDSAQRAAERMWHKEKRNNEPHNQDTKVTPKFQLKPEKEPTKKPERDPADWGDRFYGNKYTGSLGRGGTIGDVDLDIDFSQQGLKTIGKTIGAAKAVAKPFSNLAKAFKAGINKAPSSR